jgi:tRNA (cytidine/uridine-2'-O-)-methyltransferase
MFEIVLFEPEIPPNTGNIMRVCANTGCRLHLVRPLGFLLSDKTLARAGMDYRVGIDCTVHDSWQECSAALGGRRLFAVTTRGEVRYDAPRYEAGDAFVFGSETRGLGAEMFTGFAPERRIRLPMLPASRSLNLSNAVTAVVYEAWRQLDFANG